MPAVDEAELDQLLADLEEDVAAEVRAVLTEIADEYARGLQQATEIVAARFSVTSIAQAWRQRVPRLLRRLLRVSERAATTAADDIDATLPDGWNDLPQRYDDNTLPPQLGSYVAETETLLRAIGGRLANTATRELAEGLNSGETIDQLRARLRAAFNREGTQLGNAREQRIAATESTRAWNAATLGAARALTGPDRPLVKQWRIHNSPAGDSRVREPHRDADGQVRLLDDAFTVGGSPMQYPGDPSAPADLTVQCRCVLRLATAARTAATTPAEEAPMDDVTAAADGEHTGAMIALVPSEADATRLTLDGDGAEPVEDLHLTLAYLGEAAGWTPTQTNDLRTWVATLAPELSPITANLFGVNHWNPGGEYPAWVWAVGDSEDGPNLEDAHRTAWHALRTMDNRPEMPEPHSPWVAHVTGAYSTDTWPLEEMAARLGPVTFDRIRIAFAGDHTDIPLGQELEAAAMDDDETMPDEDWTPPVRGWTTPGDTALAFENQETGDGRIFAAGALHWDGSGPWPLQYAEEMLSGHDGAELAGAIQTMDRDGDRITGQGVLYLTTRAGWESQQLLEQGAPLGVSVDLDDVEVEFIDRTGNAEDEDVVPIMASLASASVLRLDDGSWIIRGHTAGEWTASGVGLARNARTVEWITAPGSTLVAAATVRDAFPHLTAAAGDPDDPEQGTLVHSESAGDLLMRIVRARVRGATLVAVPAYDQARIVLDPVAEQQTPVDEPYALAAAAHSARDRVLTYVRTSVIPVTARDIAERFDDMDIAAIRRHLAAGVETGHLVRIARGLYVGASDLPEGELAAAENHHVEQDDDMSELEASAWRAMRELPPMPAEFFRDPVAEGLLTDDSPGVNYSGGRVYGWVAKKGVPHVGYPGKNLTIEKLMREGMDFSNFLRQPMSLSDGSTVKVGPMSAGVGHHRDGAECETAACQFDNSRLTAGIVTVGYSEGHGLWFSGAAAPWLSEWDMRTFMACNPSYHLVKARRGWDFRAVLSVPVPGHPTALKASLDAVVERANLALTAAAAVAEVNEYEQRDPGPEPVVEPEPQRDRLPDPVTTAAMADAVTAAMLSPEFLDRLSDAQAARAVEREREQAELDALFEHVASIKDEITASANQTDKE